MTTILNKLSRCAAAGAALAGMTTAGAATIPLKAATFIIEYNATAEDIGIQGFLDSEGWREIEIIAPTGEEIFSAEAEGRLLRQGGGTELFFESVEPPTDELPIAKFFRRFPQGVYQFRGVDPVGNRLTADVNFSHRVPAGAEILLPAPAAGEDCAKNVPANNVVVAWNPVTETIFGQRVEIVRYEVIVETEDKTTNFDVKFPVRVGTMLTVSPELLQPGTDYIGEVLAIEKGGNQTLAEFCFTTAG
jgi:hypothetical protein